MEGIFGGFLLSVKGEEYCDFVDWETGLLIRRITTSPKAVYWADSGKFVAIVLEENFFVLEFHSEAVGKSESDEDGYLEAFELKYEILESITSGLWLSDCFIYTTQSNKVNYSLGGKSMLLVNLDKPNFIIGFIPQQNRLYLIDSERAVISYTVMISFIEYQIAVVQEDFEKAEAIFPNIPENFHNKCAKFLDSLGYKEEAMAITTDKEHKFELALQLSNLQEAFEIAQMDASSDVKWKMVGDLALLAGDFELAESCMRKAKDWNGLLLMFTSTAQGAKVRELAEATTNEGKMNVAFVCYFLLKDTDKCIDTLVKSNRIPEAAFFARTYAPSRISDVLKIWKSDLLKTSKVTSDSLTNPTDYLDKFPEVLLALKAEKVLNKFYKEDLPGDNYSLSMSVFDMDFLSLVSEDPEVDILSLLSQPPECPEDPFAV
jgi:coatomer subunit beta'